jgi:serine protease AprX
VRFNNLYKRFLSLVFALAVTGVFVFQLQAATLSSKLQTSLQTLSDSADLGMVIVAFNSNNGLQESHLNILRSVGITAGTTFPNLGMAAMPMTAAQARALQNNPAVRSIWSNDRMFYYMNQARTLTGVEKLRTDSQFIFRNGGMPVSGEGNFSVMVIDSGVDATHADLAFGTKVIQNVQTAVAAGTLPGFTPNIAIENVPNTDQTVGHGTHCAGIIGGLGTRSGGTYAGVAPGAKIIGAGLGAGLFVINGLAAWEWALSNQYRYNIRVISNSYGSAGACDPNDPIMIASKAMYDRNVTIVFAGANSGPAKGTFNTYAKAPWVIGVAAGTKEGTLADFSSRGLPREERLGNEDPLDDFDAPTITAPGTGRAFESNASKFTSAIVSTRSTVNLTANGLDADLELPLSAIPFYTQISGTSMATPFVAGTVALMLDANPNLTPDQIKQIITETATKMPGYQDFEVGAGYINAYAAVDKVFDGNKKYDNFQDYAFNAQFGENRPPQQTFNIEYDPTATPGAGSTNSTGFTVQANMNVLDVFATVDDPLGQGLGNLVGVILYAPDGTAYSSGVQYPYPLGSEVRQVTVKNPQAGTWRLEIRGARGLNAVPGVSIPTSGAALPGPVEGTITQIQFVLPTIPDIQGNANKTDIEFALKNRLIDTYADGTFRPNAIVSREDVARSLVLNTSVRQSVGASAKFADVSGELARIAEAVTAKGSTNRDYDFVPTGMMSFSGSSFNPSGSVNRLDLAVAFVKALGHDAEARAKAGSLVTSGGIPLSDNAQIPSALRGYVQIAIDNSLFEAFPAQIIQTGPGQFQALPGPRFEPNTTVNRSTLASKLNSFNALFTTGG